ncbi:hypothetical protein AMECASPLE_027095 [Ameca splendens]|uniref:Uncharacterized protein n=1 Tax=Ameca splendens TaxID=208324 RepID=A0ABV0XI85_9TELE
MHIVHEFSPVLHSSHSTSPEFASNLATLASSSSLYRRPARSSAPPTGVHLANARPCLIFSPVYAWSGTAPSTPGQAPPRLRLVRHRPVYAWSGTAPSTPGQAPPRLRLVRHRPVYAWSGTAPSTPGQAPPRLRLVRHRPVYAWSGTAPSTPGQA